MPADRRAREEAVRRHVLVQHRILRPQELVTTDLGRNSSRVPNAGRVTARADWNAIVVPSGLTTGFDALYPVVAPPCHPDEVLDRRFAPDIVAGD